ncbi:MAG: hypothetical protein ACM3U2_20990 [Deltaproteobacteria bacterium]
MKAFSIVACFALAALGGAVRIDAAPIPTTPIYTSKLKFRIPFHYDSAELSRLGAREIRLYVSRDRGRGWQPVQTVTPDAGKFHFEAHADGEYWFIVRTLDAKNHLHPDGNVTDPGLQVIVDTAAPKLELELRQPAPGKVQLLWSASDEHLDLTQLRLEYLQPGSPDWQPVTVVPKAVGQTGWALPQGGIVAVRGSIADLARNTAQDQVQLRIAPANQAVPRPDAPGSRQPVAGPAGGPRDSVALTLPEQFPSAAHPRGDGTKEDDAGEAPESKAFGPAPSADNAPAVITPRNSFVSLKPDNGPIIGGQSREPARAQDPPRHPVTGKQRMVSSLKFQIGYKLQDVGPSGVDSVELFVTDDDGATWYRYGADDDNQSPILVEVPREGTYGFVLGVRSGAGLASDPPQNGDRPAIVVTVDLTAPRLEALPVEQGRGKNANKLLIFWKCTDDNLGEKPVSLFYSANGQAPWLPISGPIENTGHYNWTIDPNLPPKFYLRIEARDLAGNVQSVESQQPIVVDLSRPTAKIIDIESPAENSVPRD